MNTGVHKARTRNYKLEVLQNGEDNEIFLKKRKPIFPAGKDTVFQAMLMAFEFFLVEARLYET